MVLATSRCEVFVSVVALVRAVAQGGGIFTVSAVEFQGLDMPGRRFLVEHS